MTGGARLPVIPETVTVHLGRPEAAARNVTVSFADYIKNVASSEIYPTWPENALLANIYAEISFALNRIYTEYYPSRGFEIPRPVLIQTRKIPRSRSMGSGSGDKSQYWSIPIRASSGSRAGSRTGLRARPDSTPSEGSRRAALSCWDSRDPHRARRPGARIRSPMSPRCQG